jgi:hypothetical protein
MFWRRLIGISFAKKADLKTGSDEIDCYFCFACHFGERRMTAITFDTLKFANRLKQAGVPSAYAEADILEANLGELATKADILDAKPSWIADEPNSLLYAKLVVLRMVVIGHFATFS